MISTEPNPRFEKPRAPFQGYKRPTHALNGRRVNPRLEHEAPDDRVPGLGSRKVPTSSQKPDRKSNIQIPYARLVDTTYAPITALGVGDLVFVGRKQESTAFGSGTSRISRVRSLSQMNRALESPGAFLDGSVSAKLRDLREADAKSIKDRLQFAVRSLNRALEENQTVSSESFYEVRSLALLSTDAQTGVTKSLTTALDFRAVSEIENWALDGVAVTVENEFGTDQLHPHSVDDKAVVTVAVQGPVNVRNEKLTKRPHFFLANPSPGDFAYANLCARERDGVLSFRYFLSTGNAMRELLFKEPVSSSPDEMGIDELLQTVKAYRLGRIVDTAASANGSLFTLNLQIEPLSFHDLWLDLLGKDFRTELRVREDRIGKLRAAEAKLQEQLMAKRKEEEERVYAARLKQIRDDYELRVLEDRRIEKALKQQKRDEVLRWRKRIAASIRALKIAFDDEDAIRQLILEAETVRPSIEERRALALLGDDDEDSTILPLVKGPQDEVFYSFIANFKEAYYSGKILPALPSNLSLEWMRTNVSFQYADGDAAIQVVGEDQLPARWPVNQELIQALLVYAAYNLRGMGDEVVRLLPKAHTALMAHNYYSAAAEIVQREVDTADFEKVCEVYKSTSKLTYEICKALSASNRFDRTVVERGMLRFSFKADVDTSAELDLGVDLDLIFESIDVKLSATSTKKRIRLMSSALNNLFGMVEGKWEPSEGGSWKRPPVSARSRGLGARALQGLFMLASLGSAAAGAPGPVIGNMVASQLDTRIASTAPGISNNTLANATLDAYGDLTIATQINTFVERRSLFDTRAEVDSACYDLQSSVAQTAFDYYGPLAPEVANIASLGGGNLSQALASLPQLGANMTTTVPQDYEPPPVTFVYRPTNPAEPKMERQLALPAPEPTPLLPSPPPVPLLPAPSPTPLLPAPEPRPLLPAPPQLNELPEDPYDQLVVLDRVAGELPPGPRREAVVERANECIENMTLNQLRYANQTNTPTPLKNIDTSGKAAEMEAEAASYSSVLTTMAKPVTALFRLLQRKEYDPDRNDEYDAERDEL